MSSICVLVTVPTESEERRLYNCSCACGRFFLKRHVDPELENPEMCDDCWRQSQAEQLEMLSEYGGTYSMGKPVQLCSSTWTTLLGTTTNGNTDSSQTADDTEATEPSLKRARQRARHDRVLDLGLSSNSPLELVVRTAAEQLQLRDVFWCKDMTGSKLQARFDMQLNERYESLLSTMQDWGIGEREGTHVVAMNCLDTRSYPHKLVDGGTERTWESFMDSVRCRLNVNQVVRQVSRDASITFDFVVLLIAATLLSCVGLVEDSFLFLSSSMLISPLMGPIIAGIFGTVIGDRRLRWLGIKNELFGIAIAVIIGLFFGVLVCIMGRFFVISNGLTAEILSRVDTHSLSIGVLTALASGAAGAIGILGGNAGSLVGVAISASLLPPAVNSGLMWSLAVGTQFMDPNDALLQNLSKHSLYSSQLPLELLACAGISMALTLINVVCIWLMGVVVLRIKEVAPAVRRNHQFWRHDVKVARECANQDPELQSAIEQLDNNKLTDTNELSLDDPMYQHTWSPGNIRPIVELSSAAPDSELNNYHTVHGFQEFCITLHKLSNVQAERSTGTVVPKAPALMQLFQKGPVTKSAIELSSLEASSGRISSRIISDADLHWTKHGASSSLVSLHACVHTPIHRQLGTGRSKRCVHWSAMQQRQHKPEADTSPAQSQNPIGSAADLQPDDAATGVATDESALQAVPLMDSAQDTWKRRKAQVLLPLPLPQPQLPTMPNRPLQLLSRQQPESTLELQPAEEANDNAAAANDEYFA